MRRFCEICPLGTQQRSVQASVSISITFNVCSRGYPHLFEHAPDRSSFRRCGPRPRLRVVNAPRSLPYLMAMFGPRFISSDWSRFVAHAVAVGTNCLCCLATTSFLLRNESSVRLQATSPTLNVSVVESKDRSQNLLSELFSLNDRLEMHVHLNNLTIPVFSDDLLEKNSWHLHSHL